MCLIFFDQLDGLTFDQLSLCGYQLTVIIIPSYQLMFECRVLFHATTV